MFYLLFFEMFYLFDITLKRNPLISVSKNALIYHFSFKEFVKVSLKTKHFLPTSKCVRKLKSDVKRQKKSDFKY